MYQTHIPATGIDPASAALVPLLRVWRKARDQGRATMPAMARLRIGGDGAVLAPVIDSLARLFELALGRPLGMGRDGALSPDEQLLLDAIAAPDRQSDWPRLSGALNGAIRSARIMLAMAGNRDGARA